MAKTKDKPTTTNVTAATAKAKRNNEQPAGKRPDKKQVTTSRTMVADNAIEIADMDYVFQTGNIVRFRVLQLMPEVECETRLITDELIPKKNDDAVKVITNYGFTSILMRLDAARAMSSHS